MLTIKRQGDGWSDFPKRTGKMGRALKVGAEQQIRGMAEAVRQHIVTNMWMNGFHVVPIKESTLKRRENKTTPPLIDTASYVNSIKVRRDPEGYRVGPEKKYDPIAAYLEFGTSKMPARPHWRPTFLWARVNLGLAGRAVLNGLAVG